VVLKNTTWVAWQNSPLVVKNHCTHLPAHSARSVVPELFSRSQGLHAAPEVVETLWPEGQTVGRATKQFAKAVLPQHLNVHSTRKTCRGNGQNGFLMERSSGNQGASAGRDKLKEPCTNTAD